MLKRLSRKAHALDDWLHRHVGRAYVAILGWGLVASIIGSIKALNHTLSRGGLGLGTIAVLVFQSALLVNQLAQWHELRERRQLVKAAAGRAAPGVAPPPAAGQG